MLAYYLMPHPPIIIPEVGKGRESEVNKTVESCKKVGERVEELNPDVVIIITPHGCVFRDAIAIITDSTIKGDLRQFGAENVKFDYKIDTELAMKIIKNSEENGVAVAKLDKSTASIYGINLELDHGAMVPLYFIGRENNYKLIHITYGMLSPMELMKVGIAINNAVDQLGKKAVFIASGDLSHRLIENGPYPYTPLGIKFDKTLMEILKTGKLEQIFQMDRKLIKEAGECGLRSLYILAGAINSNNTKAESLSYEGPLGVGYGVVEFRGNGNDLFHNLIESQNKEHLRRLTEGNPYTKLARANLDSYYNNGKTIELNNIDETLLNDRKGVFVSLKINGDLRGCIGTINPTTNSVAEEIIRNSLSAALNDPRFSPVKKDELREIDISVDLLYPAEPTTFEELDPKVYGVIVTGGNKRGLLLPNLEGVDTAKQQVEIAMEKAGLTTNDSISLERFKVERFKEVDNDE